MSILSKKSFRKVQLAVLAGVENVELHGDEIVGNWKDELRLRLDRPSGRTLVEDFVNWKTEPEEIRRFVQLYGPLCKTPPFQKPHTRTKGFRQSIREWLAYQAELRRAWRDGLSPYRVGMAEGELLTITPRKLCPRKFAVVIERIEVSSLSRFLEFELHLRQTTYRRICARPNCETRYFIATGAAQRLCSPKCAQWQQRRAKLMWWTAHGDAWRRKQRKRKED